MLIKFGLDLEYEEYILYTHSLSSNGLV